MERLRRFSGPCSVFTRARPVLVLFLALLMEGPPARATEEYAGKTGLDCAVCHLHPEGGGDLTPAGQSYGKDPGGWRAPGTLGAVNKAAKTAGGRSPAFRLLRLGVFFLHVFASFLWLGTIFYVHIILKPKYAYGGLPRSEVRLAWISMPAIAATGLLLTWFRVSVSPGLFSTRFGRFLLAKIILFTAMVATAAFVTRVIGPRLKALSKTFAASASGCPGVMAVEKETFTARDLIGYDGQEGRRGLVAVEGEVREVTASRLWKNGTHAGRHRAGQDLSSALAGAPHGPEVLERMPKAGTLAAGRGRRPWAITVFTAIAYFNLAAGIAILMIISLWHG